MRYIAYTDGSYQEKGCRAVYASAAIVAPEGTTDWKALAKVASDQYIEHRNVAGEIFAVIMLCEYLLKRGDCDEVVICYDYMGIENWITGAWRAKKELPVLYVKYMTNYVLPKIRVQFKHTPGHTGVEGNELVDKMCRDVITEHFKKTEDLNVY